jgi:tetratricopeptide (TPR) repeat protein
MSVSNNRIGNMFSKQGDLTAALASYQAALAIAERLVASDPGNAAWQRDLSVSHNKIGDVLVAQGDLTATLASYQASLAIGERLAQQDPGNAGWQRDLAFSNWRLARYGSEPALPLATSGQHSQRTRKARSHDTY